MPSTNSKDYLSKASLPLQILLFFNGIWVVLFWAITLALFIWKGVEFPYPGGACVSCVRLRLLTCVVSWCVSVREQACVQD